jgi:hypothetical protein
MIRYDLTDFESSVIEPLSSDRTNPISHSGHSNRPAASTKQVFQHLSNRDIVRSCGKGGSIPC